VPVVVVVVMVVPLCIMVFQGLNFFVVMAASVFGFAACFKLFAMAWVVVDVFVFHCCLCGVTWFCGLVCVPCIICGLDFLFCISFGRVCWHFMLEHLHVSSVFG